MISNPKASVPDQRTRRPQAVAPHRKLTKAQRDRLPLPNSRCRKSAMPDPGPLPCRTGSTRPASCQLERPSAHPAGYPEKISRPDLDEPQNIIVGQPRWFATGAPGPLIGSVGIFGSVSAKSTGLSLPKYVCHWKHESNLASNCRRALAPCAITRGNVTAGILTMS